MSILAAVALAGTAVLVWASQPRSELVPLPAPTAAVDVAPGPVGEPAPQTSTGASPPPDSTPETAVVVHVAGRVRSPGVVELPSGSRVVDALEAAGGVLPETELESVNLARVLTDGEQVRVGIPADPSLPPGSGSLAAPGPAAGQGPLDLNVATSSDLETLPGVGPVLAGRIVAWREENGPFTAVDQLLEVTGIGPAVFDDLDDRVRV